MDPERLAALISDPSQWDELTPEELTQVRQAAAAAADELLGSTDAESLAHVEQLVGIGEEAERRLAEIAAEENARTEQANSLRDRLSSLSVIINPEPSHDPSPAEINRARGRETTPSPASDDPVRQNAIVAASGVPDFQAGYEFQSLRQLAEAFISRNSNLPAFVANDRPERYRVARFNYNRPIELGEDAHTNESLLEQVQRMALNPKDDEEKAITAALCPPAEPVYEYFNLRSDFGILGADALPNVTANRGARIYPISPSIVDVYATADWFNAIAQNVATDKVCYHVDCGTYSEWNVAPRATCLIFDNFTAQFVPERVEFALSETMDVHRRKLQSWLGAGYIKQIGDLSVAKADPGLGGGAVTQLVRTLRIAGAMYRNRFRLDPSQRLILILPAWVPDVIISDVVARSATLDFNRTYAWVLSLIRDAGFDPQLVWDYQDLANNATVGHLDDVEMLMYAPGTFVALDGGTLDIGVQRDTASNQANTFQVFFEQWTVVAKVGFEGWKLTNMDLCASGGVGEAEAIACGYVS